MAENQTTAAPQAAAAEPSITGRVTRIQGSVIDVEFPVGHLPDIYNALKVSIANVGSIEGESSHEITLEVEQHLGDSTVRTVALKPTDGLVRGATVTDTGGPIKVPVGDVTKGHVFDVSGNILNKKEGETITVTERWRHGYDVFPDSNRTQPFGSGATCFYNYMDLMVRNDTPDTWRLVLQVTDTHLEGEWRADGPQTCRYEVYEKEHEIRGEYWGGFTRHNTLFRRVLGMDGAELGEEFITENHAIMMYNPMLEETAP